MQPQSRHVPPKRSFASISAAFRPYCEARIAQVYPAGPPPSTTRSKIVSAKGILHVEEATHTILFDSRAAFSIPRCRNGLFGPGLGSVRSETCTASIAAKRGLPSPDHRFHQRD